MTNSQRRTKIKNAIMYRLPCVILALGAESLVKSTNRGLRRLTSFSHYLEFLLDWGGYRSPPEWFDHFYDQYWRWNCTRNPMSWERGVFAALAMAPGGSVLDLCCGGGFITYHFYASRASSVVGVDFDPKAIAHARRNFRAANVEFRCADIRTAMPEGNFDTIVWNAAIEHFTEDEIRKLLEQVKRRLAVGGILCGYTIIEKASGKSHPEHEYEFKSKADLAGVLRRDFPNVLVFETVWRDQFEERTNVYFFASAGVLPFAENWSRQVRIDGK